MDNNILATDSICLIIDKEVLWNKIRLINEAAKEEVSDPIYEMGDVGDLITSVFTFNQDDSIYKRIIIKQIGNYRLDNTSEAAIDLYNWMISINNELINKYQPTNPHFHHHTSPQPQP